MQTHHRINYKQLFIYNILIINPIDIIKFACPNSFYKILHYILKMISFSDYYFYPFIHKLKYPIQYHPQNFFTKLIDDEVSNENIKFLKVLFERAKIINYSVIFHNVIVNAVELGKINVVNLFT